MSDATTKLELHPRALFRAIDAEEGCVLDTEGRRFFALNATGVAVLTGLTRGLSRRQIAARLSQSYGIAARTTARDLDRFLSELHTAGLLVKAAADTGLRRGLRRRRRRRREG